MPHAARLDDGTERGQEVCRDRAGLGWPINLTSDRTSGRGGWSDAQLEQYLATGHAEERGPASGPMAEVVQYSLRYLSPEDIRAMVTYLRAVTAQLDGPPAGQAGSLVICRSYSVPTDSCCAVPATSSSPVRSDSSNRSTRTRFMTRSSSAPGRRVWEPRFMQNPRVDRCWRWIVGFWRSSRCVGAHRELSGLSDRHHRPGANGASL
jgi:hypothetical protein